MNISLAPEIIFHLGGIGITNSIISGWIITLAILLGAFLVRRKLSSVPGKPQNVLELIYSYFLTNTASIIGRADVATAVFPYIMSLFFFILFSNWFGLLPGLGTIGVWETHKGTELLVPFFRAPTSDLNTTLALALCTVVYIQYLGFRYAGVKAYAGKFINVKGPIEFFVGIIEIFSELTRILSFGFRLFGNIFAGEVLISVIFYLTIKLMPFIAVLPLPFFVIELFVGAVQAYIFSFLTIVFIALAVSSHDSHSHEEKGKASRNLQAVTNH